MRKLIGVVGCLFLLFVSPDLAQEPQKKDTKKDTFETVLDSTIKVVKDFTKILNGIENKEAVAAAKPKLEEQLKELDKIAERMKKVEKPDQKEIETLAKKHEKAIKDLFAAAQKTKQYPEVKELIRELAKRFQQIHSK